MKIISINTPTLFSYKECLKFLGRSENECLFSIENEKVRKLFNLDGAPVLIKFWFDDDVSLKLQFLNIMPSESQVLYIKNYIENWLDFNFELQAFYEIVKNDKILKSLAQNYHGLRLVGIPDFYEAICWAIIGQQINLNFAYSVKRNLVEKFGNQFQFEEKLYYQFPSPEKVLSISDQEFGELKFSRQKIAYIRAISENILNQSIDIQLLKKNGLHNGKERIDCFARCWKLVSGLCFNENIQTSGGFSNSRRRISKRIKKGTQTFEKTRS